MKKFYKNLGKVFGSLDNYRIMKNVKIYSKNF